MKPIDTSIKHTLYTITQLTAEVKTLLEESFPIIWITGEISNFSKPTSGHFYFTLKDKHAQIRGVMFKGQNKRLLFEPENGMQITGLGRLSVYEPRGTYQIILEHLDPKGVGALQVAFDQLKTKLAQEGLFDDAIKKPLPLLPQKISIITSPTGAVVHDIIQIIYRRFPNVHLEVIPVSVQGDRAAGDIVDALSMLNSRGGSDVAILARGGGSLEDLQPFNSEDVARAIYSLTIPIISAVGHETDFTISDFVADSRASTPSAAAELVVPNRHHLKKTCNTLTLQLKNNMAQVLNQARFLLERVSGKMTDPIKKIQDLRLKSDDLLTKLILLFSQESQKNQAHLGRLREKLSSESPLRTLSESKLILKQNYDNILKSFKNYINYQEYETQKLHARLRALDPASILKRGYSITRTIHEQKVVSEAETVSIGEGLEVLLAKGSLFCIVEGKTPDVKKNI